jgi:hypothetical protein
MKRLLITMIMIMGFATPATAQQFNGFDFHMTGAELKTFCNKTGGVWNTAPLTRADGISDKGMLKVKTHAACLYADTLGFGDAKKTDPANPEKVVFKTPGYAMFWLDSHDRVEVAFFSYLFDTWSFREHARMSAISQLTDWFPLTVKRIKNSERSSDAFKLNNTKFFLEFWLSPDPANGVMFTFSKERAEYYLKW